jgi:hypothetical protein
MSYCAVATRANVLLPHPPQLPPRVEKRSQRLGRQGRDSRRKPLAISLLVVVRRSRFLHEAFCVNPTAASAPAPTFAPTAAPTTAPTARRKAQPATREAGPRRSRKPLAISLLVLWSGGRAFCVNPTAAPAPAPTFAPTAVPTAAPAAPSLDMPPIGIEIF